MHLRNVLCLSAVVILLGATSTALAAGVPDSICYQGVLLDGGGTPVTTPVTVDFNIYDSPTIGMGASWWWEQQLVTPDAEGRFTVYLGAGAPAMFPDLVFQGPNRYLEVWIQGEANPMTPRIPMTSVPYAFRVGSLDQAFGGNIMSSIMVEGGIKGGKDNVLLTGFGFVCGKNNWVDGDGSVISGGEYNEANVGYATVGGGLENKASYWHSTVGGGRQNLASGQRSVVAGGDADTAAGTYSAVLGGRYNYAGESYSSVGGGQYNRVTGQMSWIPCGNTCEVSGYLSIASGDKAKATHDGSWVWADRGNYDFYSSADKEFSVRARGGVRFVTSVDGSGVPIAGVQLASGGSSWSTISDRNRKENFTPITGREVLEKLAQLEISTWNYKAQDPSIRHIGPMAQDIYAAFGVGEDDRHITTIDADGIALAAIQGLYEQNAELKRQVAELQALVQRMLAEQK